jgi:hypothetical protein
LAAGTECGASGRGELFFRIMQAIGIRYLV